jgi:hypothetical protein
MSEVCNRRVNFEINRKVTAATQCGSCLARRGAGSRPNPKVGRAPGASSPRASGCERFWATVHALAQPLRGTERRALQALLEQARLPTWRLWARDAAIEKKDVLKARGYAWSPGELGAEMLVSRRVGRR